MKNIGCKVEVVYRSRGESFVENGQGCLVRGRGNWVDQEDGVSAGLEGKMIACALGGVGYREDMEV
jgi:hypothetical protein